MRRGVRRAIGTGLGVMLGAGLAWGATEAAQPEVMDDTSYHNGPGDHRYNDLEKRMSNAVNEMYGTEVYVRCADPVDDSKTLKSTGAIALATGVKGPLSSTQDLWISANDERFVRIAPPLCDAMENVDTVTKHSPLEFAQAATAVSALAFQGVHAKFEGEDLSDGVLKCKAIQETGHLARNMGAGVKESIGLGMTIANAEPLVSAPGQRPPVDCVDDGPHDLLPMSPGIMPYGGSATYPAPGN